MNCRQARLLISRRVDGDLSPAEEHLLDFHLLGCSSCRRAMDMTRDMSELMRGLGHPEVPEQLERRILERVRLSSASSAPGAGRSRSGVKRIALLLPPVAAAFLLVLSIRPAGERHVLEAGRPSLALLTSSDEDAVTSKPCAGRQKSGASPTTYRTYPLLAYSREGGLVSF